MFSLRLKNGGERDEVDEPLFPALAVVCFEFEAWPEPKALRGDELRALYARYGSQKAVARVIGVSRVFVTEKLRKSK